jgi:RNA polymerase sigma-70 factor (ECF subfamily)
VIADEGGSTGMSGAGALCPVVEPAQVVRAGASTALAPRLRAPLRTFAEEEGTDAALMARVAAGDAAAFAQVVDRYKDPLVGYLARMTNCRDRAEEFAQETFLRLYQNARRYRERGHLSAYLYRIATNLLRSDERRRRRFRLIEGWIVRSERCPEPSAQGHALHREATDLVAAAIHELPATFRAPLVLREIDGWSYAEIARALGCRVGTVKSRIHRAKAQLRQALEPYWNGEA